MTTSRDRFEDWYSGGWEYPAAVERSGEGYRLAGANSAWGAWDAATHGAASVTGCKMVPTTPTAEMLKAAAEIDIKSTRGFHDRACYIAMVDAAPENKL